MPSDVPSVTTPPASLAAASRALWLATLSLMTAFMQNQAPAHRLLLARRIARNFQTLAHQPECFGADTCGRFARLATRWQAQAEALVPDGERRGGWGHWLRSLRAIGPAR